MLLAPGLRAESAGPAASPSAPPAPSAAPPASAGPADAPPSGATENTADVNEARDAFRLASALAKQGQWSDALAAFERSDRLLPHPVTTYNVAYCERALGHFVSAYRSFQRSLSEMGPDGAKLSADLESQAKAYLAEIEQRVARVSVTLTSGDVTVRVDGHGLERLNPTADRAVWVVAGDDAQATAPLPAMFDLWVDPGSHVFVASRPGQPDAVVTRPFSAGATERLGLPPPVPAAPPPAAATSAPPEPLAGDTGLSVSPKPNRTWAFVAFGAGAAGLVTSSIFAGLSLGTKGGLTGCSNKTCPLSEKGDEDRMKTYADVATAGLIVGGVGAAVGTYLWLTAKPSSEKPSAKGLHVAPWVGLGSAGVDGRF